MKNILDKDGKSNLQRQKIKLNQRKNKLKMFKILTYFAIEHLSTICIMKKIFLMLLNLIHKNIKSF